MHDQAQARLGNPGASGDAGIDLSQPPQILAASGFGLAAAALPGIGAAPQNRSDRRPLSGAAQQPNTRSSGRSRRNRSTPTTTISTNSAPTRTSPAPPRRCRSGRGRSRSTAWSRRSITIDIDDLIRKMPLEERLYRHRCVEAWSMTVPWTGFPLATGRARQAARRAKYLRMETFIDPDVATGQKQILVSVALCRRSDHGRGDQRTRLPGHRRLRQAGGEVDGRAAPPPPAVEIRLQVDQVDRPLHFTDEQPVSFWQQLAVQRIWLLGQRQSGGAASALEPGDGARIGTDDRCRPSSSTAMASSSPASTRGMEGRAALYVSGRLFTPRPLPSSAGQCAQAHKEKPGPMGPAVLCRISNASGKPSRGEQPARSIRA